ncbi:three component ABC system middle component [Paenibacillus lautus]|uniref:three component ABC system middle component n=1 Tax=Paenibacillus lautus TaxID=1401 RepID=UPI003D27A2E5
MMTPKNLYNNEMIGAIAIYSVLFHLQTISVAKSMLIFPFISHQGTLDFLKNNKTTLRSLEEFIIKKPDFFSNYNDRFFSLLTLSVNSLILLKEIELIKIENSEISIDLEKKLDINKESFGLRAFNISMAGKKLSEILKDNDKNLYLQLKVKL